MDAIDELLDKLDDIVMDWSAGEESMPSAGNDEYRAAVVEYTNQVLAVRDEQIERLAVALEQMACGIDWRRIEDKALQDIYKDRLKTNEHRADAELCAIRAMISFAIEGDE